MDSLEKSHDVFDPAVDRALTEAATWLVWKQGPDWSEARQQGLEKWLAENELHRFAYRYSSQVHTRSSEAIRRSAKVEITAPRARDRPARLSRVRRWAVAAILVLAVGGWAFFLYQPALSTGIGEHRTELLADGTEVTLNTASTMIVSFNAHQRQVRLVSGEAYFKVAKRPEWPFVVTAGDREITAIGTAFVVRHEHRRTAVTLMEGKVAVTAAAQSVDERKTPAGPPVMLAPGERLTFDSSDQAQLDRPEVEKTTAWRHGVVDIDNMTLGQAAAEMNRYSKLQLVVDSRASQIRVGGVFRSTDARKLAKTVALTYGLSLKEDDGRLVLSGVPQPATDQALDSNRTESGL